MNERYGEHTSTAGMRKSHTLAVLAVLASSLSTVAAAGKIDRHAVVSRHDIVYTRPEIMAPLTVGNGKFAFTVDPTGLQTFAESYDKGVSLSTMAEWGWHNMPNPNNYKIEDTYREFDSHGRKVAYAYNSVLDPMSPRGEQYQIRDRNVIESWRAPASAARPLTQSPHCDTRTVGTVSSGRQAPDRRFF